MLSAAIGAPFHDFISRGRNSGLLQIDTPQLHNAKRKRLTEATI